MLWTWLLVSYAPKGKLNEADNLAAATVHWLRHTGISEDVKYALANTYVMMQGIVPVPPPTAILI